MKEHEFLELLNDGIRSEGRFSYEEIVREPETAESRIRQLWEAYQRLQCIRKECVLGSHFVIRRIGQQEFLRKVRSRSTKVDQALKTLKSWYGIAKESDQWERALLETGSTADQLSKFYQFLIPIKALILNAVGKELLEKMFERIDPIETELYEDGDYQSLAFDALCDAFESEHFAPQEYLGKVGKLSSEINPGLIARRLDEVGPLILSQEVPWTMVTNLERARKYYSYGMPEATVIFCGAMLEAALVNYWERTSQGDPPYGLRLLLRRIVGRNRDLKPLEEGAKDVIDMRNSIVHLNGSATMEDALKCLKASYAFLEKLYG